MAEDKDYKEVLSGTVEEVKDKVKNMESPNYRELLKLEKEGEDRQTLKEFLNRKIDTLKGDNEDTSEDQESEETEESEEAEETEDTAEYENRSFAEKLRSLSVGKILLIGGVGGLIVGLLLGYGLGPGAASQGPGEATDSMQQLIDAGDFDGTADVGEPELRNGLYYFNISLTQETENGTQEGHQTYYVTQDGQLLFPEIAQNPFMPQVPIDIDQVIAAQQQQQEQQDQQEQEPQQDEPPTAENETQ